MTTLLYANNIKTTLASPISSTATTITLAPSGGTGLPSPTGGQSFRLTLVDNATGLVYEIIDVTTRSGDVLTASRGAEGTTARAWLAGDNVIMPPTAGSMANLAQNNGYGANGTWGISITGSAVSSITQAPGTNNTLIATTAFVVAAIAAANAFPSGTRMGFFQSVCPTGWVQDTSDTANNRMMRVVNDGSSGGGVGGGSDPTLMNVVPYHTHGFSTGYQSNDHAHYSSGETGGMDANNPHNHSGGDYGHGHNLNGEGIFGQSRDGTPYDGYTAGFVGGYPTAHIDGIATGYASVYINTTDINHGHAWGAWSGGVNANHTHSGSTDGGSSSTNWSPRYVNQIIGQKT